MIKYSVMIVNGTILKKSFSIYMFDLTNFMNELTDSTGYLNYTR